MCAGSQAGAWEPASFFREVVFSKSLTCVFQMCHGFFGGFFRQIDMLQLGVIDGIIQTRDACIQVFIGGFRMGLAASACSR